MAYFLSQSYDNNSAIRSSILTSILLWQIILTFEKVQKDFYFSSIDTTKTKRIDVRAKT